MIPLLAFVLSSSSLFLIFRGMKKDDDPLPVLLLNYFFCSLFSLIDLFFQGEKGGFLFSESLGWLPFAAALGFLYLLNFSLTEKTVRYSGAAISSVATKLSLVLPFFFTLWINHQRPDFKSVCGLIFCMAAIFLCAFKPEKKADGATPAFAWVLPLCVFLGTGITDILTQWLNQEMVPESSSGWMIMVVFMSAAATALVLLVFRRPFKIKRNSIFTGFLLGLPNFISYKSILAALSSFHHKGDVVFPLANLGVIVCTSLLAALIFKDRLSRLNLIGLVLALFSLSLFFRMP